MTPDDFFAPRKEVNEQHEREAKIVRARERRRTFLQSISLQVIHDMSS